MNIDWQNIKERIKKGVYLASNSFAMLWNHKILLIYLTISISTYFLMQMISYNLSGYDVCFSSGLQSLGQLFDLSHWHHYLWLLLLTFVYVFLSTFVTIALIYHVYKLNKHESVTFKKSFGRALKKINLIVIWSVIVTMLTYAIQLISNRVAQPKQFFNPIMLIVSLLGLAWTLFTLMVLPIIALESTTIKDAFKQSKDMVLAMIPEILSGEFWIGLTALLAMIPFAIPMLFNLRIPAVIVLIGTALIFCIGLIITTVQVIFKTFVYTYYMKPLEELKKLKYPRF